MTPRQYFVAVGLVAPRRDVSRNAWLDRPTLRLDDMALRVIERDREREREGAAGRRRLRNESLDVRETEDAR